MCLFRSRIVETVTRAFDKNTQQLRSIHYTAILFTSLGISHDRRGLGVDVRSRFVDTAHAIRYKIQMSKTVFTKSQFVYIFQHAANICNSVWVLCWLLLYRTQPLANTAIKIQTLTNIIVLLIADTVVYKLPVQWLEETYLKSQLQEYYKSIRT